MNELGIKNISPYDVIKIIEENGNGQRNNELANKISSDIKAAGYKNSIEDFIDYINEEIEKEVVQDEENEELEE